MASGIIIHVTVGKEKVTEFFSEERIRIGSDDTNDLQIRTDKLIEDGNWLELEREAGVYRVIDFKSGLDFTINGEKLLKNAPIEDGDAISINGTEIGMSFFALTSKSSLITTNREQRHIQFIEEAAIGSAI